MIAGVSVEGFTSGFTDHTKVQLESVRERIARGRESERFIRGNYQIFVYQEYTWEKKKAKNFATQDFLL